MKGAPEGAPRLCLAAAAVIVVVAAAAPVPVVAAVAEQQDQDDDPPPVVVQAAAQTVIITAHRNTSEAGLFELHRSFHVIPRRHFCAEAGKKLCLTKGFGRDIMVGKDGFPVG